MTNSSIPLPPKPPLPRFEDSFGNAISIPNDFDVNSWYAKFPMYTRSAELDISNEPSSTDKVDLIAIPITWHRENYNRWILIKYPKLPTELETELNESGLISHELILFLREEISSLKYEMYSHVTMHTYLKFAKNPKIIQIGNYNEWIN